MSLEPLRSSLPRPCPSLFHFLRPRFFARLGVTRRAHRTEGREDSRTRTRNYSRRRVERGRDGGGDDDDDHDYYNEDDDDDDDDDDHDDVGLQSLF